jgi:hypothetical protein
VPAISYRPRINEIYDNGFYRLPNLVSYQCFNFEQLQETLTGILNGRLGALDGDERRAVIDENLAAQDGALACERIVDILEQISQTWTESAAPGRHRRILGRGLANGRRLVVFFRKYFKETAAPPEFHRHRYPEISLEHLRAKLNLFQQLRGSHRELKVEQISGAMFKISP